jgi:hypothetical protein
MENNGKQRNNIECIEIIVKYSSFDETKWYGYVKCAMTFALSEQCLANNRLRSFFQRNSLRIHVGALGDLVRF